VLKAITSHTGLSYGPALRSLVEAHWELHAGYWSAAHSACSLARLGSSWCMQLCKHCLEVAPARSKNISTNNKVIRNGKHQLYTLTRVKKDVVWAKQNIRAILSKGLVGPRRHCEAMQPTTIMGCSGMPAVLSFTRCMKAQRTYNLARTITSLGVIALGRLCASRVPRFWFSTTVFFHSHPPSPIAWGSIRQQWVGGKFRRKPPHWPPWNTRGSAELLIWNDTDVLYFCESKLKPSTTKACSISNTWRRALLHRPRWR
jgi:hypothetical protein